MRSFRAELVFLREVSKYEVVTGIEASRGIDSAIVQFTRSADSA